MKFFRAAQKYFAVVGFSSQQLFQEHRPNERTLLAIFSLVIQLISSAVFLFYEANSSMEYTNSIYITSTVTLAAFNFSTMSWKQNNLFKFVKNLENAIQEREYK